MNIKKGDMVVVLSGAEKGKTGKVLSVFLKDDTVLIERVRLMKRHTKPGRGGNMQGGIVEKEAPLHVSKVALIDPKTKQATRVRRQFLADGSKQRVAARSGEAIG